MNPRTHFVSPEVIFEKSPEILETVYFFGMDLDTTGKYLCALYSKYSLVGAQEFESAGRMRDVQREYYRTFNTGQKQVIEILETSMRNILPQIGTHA